MRDPSPPTTRVALADHWRSEAERLRAALDAVTTGQSRSECRRIAHEALGHVLQETRHSDEWVMPEETLDPLPTDYWESAQ